MHDVLLGRKPLGVALARREMLLRGSPCHLARFIPLFDVAPILYREHLTDLGLFGFHRPPVNGHRKEVTMNDQPDFKGEAIPLENLSAWEKALCNALNGVSYGLGYAVGTLRYRVLHQAQPL